MALQIGRTFGRGARRALSVSGIVLMILTLISQFLLVGSVNTVFRSAVPPAVRQQAQFGLTLPVSGSVAGALSVGALLIGVVVTVAGARVLTRDVSELNSVPVALFTRRFGRAVLSALGAGIVVTVSVPLGYLLIVPGLFLSVSFAFVTFFIALEDERAVTALRRSWGLAAGNRWHLLAIVLVALVVHGLVSIVTAVFALADPAVAQILNLVVTSVILIAYLGIFAEAYLQLRKPLSRSREEATA